MYTVRQHLKAINRDSSEWVISLGELIQQVAQCDAAVAASRASDLSKHPELARALESFVNGWLGVIHPDVDQASLTPVQIRTLELVIQHIVQTTSQRFLN